MNKHIPLIADNDKAGGDKPLSELVRAHVTTYFSSHQDGLPAAGVYARLLPMIEKPLIEVTLEAVGGNQLRAAEVLGINRNTLRKKIAGLGILPQRKQP
jgi:two-component system nitrogen regulation response regulator GlnG